MRTLTNVLSFSLFLLVPSCGSSSDTAASSAPTGVGGAGASSDHPGSTGGSTGAGGAAAGGAHAGGAQQTAGGHAGSNETGGTSAHPAGGAPGDAGGSAGGAVVANHTFSDDFDWKGTHATTTEKGATTVWWNSDAWDVRGDSDFLCTDVSDNLTTGFSVDIRKAASPEATAGARDTTTAVTGGDGSRGIGVMHLDEQDIVSARLRNPVAISAAQPAVVTFFASRFVTTGHWWEISISPAERVVGAELSPVPGNAANCDPAQNNCNEGLLGPVDADNGTPGPGHRPAEESINFVTTGWPDIPTCSGFPFYFRMGVEAQIGGGEPQSYVNYVNVFGDPEALPETKPEEIDDLFAWRVEYRPDGVDAFADFGRDGSFSYHQHFALTIPWSLVHLHLLGIAYQADHHPQAGCGLQGTTREIVWRDVTVSPVAYAKTSIAPQEGAARAAGFMAYDLRNVADFGPPVGGNAQPNDGPYSQLDSYAFGSSGDARPKVQTMDLDVDLTAEQASAAAAKLVYDIEGTGTVELEVNGKPAGALPPATTAPGAATPGGPASASDFRFIWVHRGASLMPSLFTAGKNHLHLTFSGPVVMDRLTLEFGHDGP